jgi:DivIVA domain-containing protein
MDSSISTPSLDVLRTIDFQNGFRGYNVEEVDTFLDKAAEELDALRDQYRQMQNQLRLAADRIKQLESTPRAEGTPAPVVSTPQPAPTPEVAPTTAVASVAASQEVTSIIAMAQEFVATAKREATEKASALTHQAQEQARRILDEAKSNALDEVTQLEGRKARLAEEVTTLARFITAERNRLKSSLGEMSQWIDNSLAVRETSAPAAPAAPAPAPAPAHVAPAPASEPVVPAPTTPSESPRITTIGEVAQFKLDND